MRFKPLMARRGWRAGFLAVIAALVAAGTLVGVPVASAATIDTNVWYQLVNRNSGKAIDVCNVSSADGACVQQWARWSGHNQQFQFVDAGGGYYKLRARHSGKVLDVSGQSTADGAGIVQGSDSGGSSQQFRLADSDGGYVRMINRNSGKALEVWQWSTADGGRIVQYTDHGGANQQWQLVNMGSVSGGLPSSFRWSSGGPIIGPKNDATHTLSAIKDPSVVYYNGRHHVFATVTSSTGAYSMVYLSFTDWSQAGSATHHFLDRTPVGGGYKAAPQIFYFAPQGLWYLVYQTGNDASYSTNPDISNPSGWSAPRGFYGGMPQIIRDNIGDGYWVDMWVICDSANCYLFSSDDNGHLYRSQTSVSNFPNGMSQPVIAMQDANKFNLFEASNVYKVAGTNQYLLIIEAIGSTGRRYFRSWTSTSIAGTWTPLAATEGNPFAGTSNVTFAGAAWTNDISHGEMIRAGYDQTLTISPCRMQYLYQGRDPNVDTGNYSTLPWRLALLNQTNSTC